MLAGSAIAVGSPYNLPLAVQKAFERVGPAAEPRPVTSGRGR
ncbi:hypothetical protein [Streptomyces sp. NBC_01803]|nr:hypothetical protein [Streptomyces sp. NBC_01803]WSA42831.1 hypothetical protein OIE51_00595 [Streptomyces sp. NBC_01803]